jgi:alkanesulfonate monooxygenase SsuD/methylene tetrahydromethanopterin reductase-like flavin-dependent oxidoreductase (luciferase family)
VSAPTLFWTTGPADEMSVGSVGLRARLAESNGVGHLVIDHPVLDTFALAAAALAATTSLRVVAVVDPTAQHPFLLARAAATLDHVGRGRLAVLLENSGTAPDVLADVVTALDALWNSWDADAQVLDEASGTFADPAKVRPIHHEGPHVRTRGPLNVPHAPQPRLPLWARTPVPASLTGRFDVVLDGETW